MRLIKYNSCSGVSIITKSLEDFSLIELLPDAGTDNRLLPIFFHQQDNSDRLKHCRIALKKALKSHVTPRQCEVLKMYYIQGLRKSEIAKALHLTPSAVTKSLDSGVDELRKYTGVYMEVYDSLKKDFLSGKM